ncbi:hypothetical protein AMK59_3573 [Oryctes borbonicus]|uniref:Uncharacterized protein n=1 Tax=Oryctes borbonicus TaxID=1629725 RepID=A0A0T6B8K6_9SCAR|nr:hypothetical protein AMK59_3573 [Oryctes borbonicus]
MGRNFQRGACYLESRRIGARPSSVHDLYHGHSNEHLRRARNRALGAARHLYPILSNSHLNPKTGVMLYKTHMHPILTYTSTIWVTATPPILPSLPVYKIAACDWYYTYSHAPRCLH